MSQIESFSQKHSVARNPLAKWAVAIEAASWKSIVDVRFVYPHADFIPTGETIFNIGGNKFRLVARINYVLQAVTVMEVLTHAQYSRKFGTQ